MHIRQLGRVAYEPTFAAMRDFTDKRTDLTPDEIWVVEHDPVFTLGLAADPSHVLNPQGIPVVQTDRGGEVTYHGPGQAVIYLLMDLRRRRPEEKMYVREFVRRIEQSVIDMLDAYDLNAERKEGAPGIYIAQADDSGCWRSAKIAALGLKVRSNGSTYHGVALNVAMDLAPFAAINPCGYAGLDVVDLKTMGIDVPLGEAQTALVKHLKNNLGSK
jgi:lipoyl(octanoyl) transferase